MITDQPQLLWRDLTIAFIGCVAEGHRTLEGLLERGERVAAAFTFHPDKAATVSGAVRWEELTGRYGVPLHYVTSINDPEPVAALRALRPDVAFCVGWTQLLGREILDTPRLGCLGFHASLLPYYRGRAPVNWALINGETVTGNTLMLLDEGVDTGDIVAQRAIPITDTDTCATVYDKVAESELDMLDEVLPMIHVGAMPRRAQDHDRATVVGRRRASDGVIDWGRSTTQLDRWVRALTHPYPGAFTTLGGSQLFIWAAHPAADVPARFLAPGRLRFDSVGNRLLAGTGDGALVLDVVQYDGAEELDGRAFASRWLDAKGALAGGAP